MFTIRLGHEGPTDSCLNLLGPDGIENKEAQIESEAWRILGILWNPNLKSMSFNYGSDEHALCDLVWRYANFQS